MHIEKRKLIRERAEKIGKIAAYILMHFEGDEEVAAAMKYSWLMLRGPKSLLQRWGEDDLDINAEDVRGFLWQRQEDLGFSTCALLAEEAEILAWHNDQAKKLCSARLPNPQHANVIALPAQNGPRQ